MSLLGICVGVMFGIAIGMNSDPILLISNVILWGLVFGIVFK